MQAEMVKLARMRAMLQLIRWEENIGASDNKACHDRFGRHDPISDADMAKYVPKPEKYKDKRGNTKVFTAAGAYQILGKTLRDVSDILGIKDFTYLLIPLL